MVLNVRCVTVLMLMCHDLATLDCRINDQSKRRQINFGSLVLSISRADYVTCMQNCSRGYASFSEYLF